jgi:preprotein translocase subunit SecG
VLFPLPLMTVPIMIFSIVLVVTSVALAMFVLMHKGRGGGLSDLFGGGISSSMGGSSVAERNLDRLTVIIGVIWLAAIVALGLLYKLGA